MHALLRSSTSNRSIVPPRLTSPPASSNCWAIIFLNLFGSKRSVRLMSGACGSGLSASRFLPQEVRDDTEDDGHLVITALLHRLLHPFRGQVGVDEVSLLVVDDLQLIFQPQEKLHALLEQVDRVVALLLPTLWGLIAFRSHEFIEHGVVLFELLVEPLIIGLLAYMHDGDQIDFDTLLAAGGDVLGDR